MVDRVWAAPRLLKHPMLPFVGPDNGSASQSAAISQARSWTETRTAPGDDGCVTSSGASGRASQGDLIQAPKGGRIELGSEVTSTEPRFVDLYVEGMQSRLHLSVQVAVDVQILGRSRQP